MQNPEPTRGRQIRLLVVVIRVIVIAVIAVFASNALLHPTVTSTVVNQTISVSPGSSQKFSFAVPDGSSNVRLREASPPSLGGSGNDIIVSIVDNFGTSLYNSGQVTIGNFAVTLSSGQTYSLVFDNTFSTVSTKLVSAQATLSYSK